jgi:hypothetical protein
MVILLNNWVNPSNKGDQFEWPMKGCPNLLEGMVLLTPVAEGDWLAHFSWATLKEWLRPTLH